jgi:hypothetical protein
MGRPGNQRRHQLHQAAERLAPSRYTDRAVRIVRRCGTFSRRFGRSTTTRRTAPRVAGPRYVQAGERGIHRRRHGRGFAYRNCRGRPVPPKVIARISRSRHAHWEDVVTGMRLTAPTVSTGNGRKSCRADAVAHHIPSHANTPALRADGIRDALWVRLIRGHPSTCAPEVPRYQVSSLITEHRKTRTCSSASATRKRLPTEHVGRGLSRACRAKLVQADPDAVLRAWLLSGQPTVRGAYSATPMQSTTLSEKPGTGSISMIDKPRKTSSATGATRSR